MKQKLPQGKNLKLTLFFLLGVFGIIAISLLWKLSVLIAESRFDGRHQFILELRSEPVKVVSFSPESSSVSILTVKGSTKLNELGRELEIPIDAYISGGKDTSASQVLSFSLFHFRNDSDINIIDKLKLWWFLKSVHSDSITMADVVSPLTEDVYNNVIQKLFTDKTLYQESKSIQIINATGKSGYASRLSHLLTDIGGNVIMITTAQVDQDTTTMTYIGNITYTSKRIEKLLQLQGIQSQKKEDISDIIITIGRDKINSTIF